MFKHTRFTALVMSMMLCVGSLQMPVWAADLDSSTQFEANAAGPASATAPSAAIAEDTAVAANDAADTTTADTTTDAAATDADANDAAAADAATTDATAAADTSDDASAAETLTETDLPDEALIGDTSDSSSDTTTTEIETDVTPTPTPGGTWNNITWTLAANNTRLVITGSGEMPDATNAPWQTDEYRNTITEIRTGNYISNVGANAFKGFTALTTVKFGLRIRTIGTSAFENCTKLSKINNTSNRLSTIGVRAFADCESLPEAFLPDTLVTISKEAFYSCSSIRTVMTLSNVKTIGDAAFAYGAGLSHVYVSENVTTVGKNIFMGCDGPMAATVNSYILGEGMFRDCTGLHSLTIGSDVIGIGMYACQNCTSLKEVTIPGGASAIGDYAFDGCLGLESVDLAEGITHICQYAFYNTGLKSLTLPSSLEYMGKCSFANCSDLKTVNLASGALTAIPESCFSRDFRLTDVTLVDGLQTIGNNAFEHCNALVNINFPSTLETIGNEAFIQDYALESISIGISVREIGTKAFYYCSNLEKVTLGKGLEKLGKQAFAFCFSLNSITVYSRTVAYADNSVFRNSNSNMVMYGYYGSTSETFAKNNDITFESVSSMGAPTLRVCSSVRTGVSLKWNAVSGAVNYSIYRKAYGDSTETLVKTTKSLAYLDTDIVSGTVYTYYIVADDGSVTSEPSESRSVAFVPAPKSVSLTNTLNGMQLVWPAVANADKYIIYRKTANTGYEIIAKVSSSTLKYYDKHAVSGTIYTYAVATYIEKFGTEVRNITGAMRETRTYMRLTTPTIASVTSPAAGTMIVSWGKLDTARGYQVRYTTDSTFKKDVKAVTIGGKNSLTKTFTGLESGKTYYVRVLCYQKSGTKYYYSGNSYKKSVKIQ